MPLILSSCFFILNKILYAYIINHNMISNYFDEPLVKNYTAPKYPLFIALQNCLNSISSKKSIRDTKSDISSFVKKIGPEGEKFVLTWLMESLDLPDFKEKALPPHRIPFLTEVLKQYSSSESFLFYFPGVLAKLSKTHNLSVLIQNLCMNLKLPSLVQTSIALSLYLSDRPDFIEQGQVRLVAQLKQITKNNKGSELSKKILQQLLFQISRNPELSLKLQQEYNYLLQVSDKTYESDVSIYNFLKCDWQFFADQNCLTEKPNQLFNKKVDYIRELGPCISSQPELLKNLFAQMGPLTQDDIFQCLFMMTEQKSRTDNGVERFAAQFLHQSKKNFKAEELKKCLNTEYTSKKSIGTWNIDNFINVCNQVYVNIKWQNVFAQFDRPKLQIESEEHFLYLMKVFDKTKRGPQKWKVPENLYLKKWNNPYSQSLFLIHLFSCKDVDAFFLSEVPTTKKIQKTGIKDNMLAQKQIWAHVDLVQLLVQLSDYRFNQIRQLFEIPTAKCPQVLLTTLSEIRPSKGQALLDEVISILLPPYLQNHSTNVKLLDTLWENNQDLVISCISEIYKTESKKQNSFNLSRVLDITQSIKESLIPFTTWNDYEFSIPLAVIAGKREFLNFQPWIIDRIQKLSNSFVRSILIYIQNYLLKHLRTMPHASHKQNILEKAQLNIDLLSKIFYTIMSKLKRQEISYRNFELLKRIFKECCEYFPQITENQIPDQIERETERQINRIYREEITVKQAIERMKKLKNSQKQEDQEQFASHVTFLCSEISYHHTYPEKQLMITADLFAAIINANLIDLKIYNMFLNVLEQDLKEDNQKYYFSLKVIEKIKPKLSQEPWLCQKLIDNELLMRKNPEIVDQLIKNLSPPKQLSTEKQRKIKEAIKLKNAPPPQPPITVVLPADEEISIEGPKKSEQSDYQILIILDTSKKIQIPDKETKSCKINLACNTLSINNVEEKSKDLKKIVEGDANTMKWLAYNIVFKRISTTTQNNGFEVMYKLVEKLPIIEKPVLKITYKILQEWFALKNKSVNDKKLSNFKNIGAWLGKLTVGKGCPIPMHKLNIRKILIQSYNSHRLNMNVPVVLKILQNIHTHPEIFKNSSPWLSRIVGTLSEIEDKLKDEQSVGIKNQIKAFFKSNMKIDHFPIAQTSYLNLTNNNRIIISELDKYIKIDPELQKKYLLLKIDLKSIITRAVDDSIQQIVEPVIDRAVKIAKVTTKQLITKDFAFEPDPDRFRQSSYKLVKEMAGPLAQVTCREPLKASMNRSLKNMLLQSITDQIQIQNIIQRAVADNLDFGCTLIKQAVVQSAQDVIKKDQTINQGIQIRFSSKVQGIPFKNDSQLQIPSIVPQQLRPRPGGLTDLEYEVYSEFKKQKDHHSPERIQERSNAQKVIELISEKGPTKTIKQLLQNDFCSKEEIMTKIHTCLGNETNQQVQIQYYFDVCQTLKDFVDSKQCWRSFKEINDIKKKEIHRIVRKLVREKYFPETALNELDKSSEEQNKVVTLFQNWLQTAHEGIEPFLRNLEQMFNKSQNQIKMFFSYSLHYAMQKVSESFSEIHDSYDTNYIENYTKLIIISYKTIASNNCSLYLEHTIQSILDVFNKLQNSSSEFSYQRPFFKLFTNLICDVTRKQYDIDHEKVLTFYCVLAKQLQKIGPITCPNFTFAWVELICNKNFMPALLMKYEYWDLYYHLLSCLLKFVREYITEQNLTRKENCLAYQTFYLGVVKLIIVILHDFPDFLSQFSLQLTLLAGPRFHQLNNVIISAFPKEMKFQAPVKIDKREQFVAQCKKGGMPKYYKLKFDKPKLNLYLQTDPRQASFRQRLKAEDDQSLQLLVLYTSWTSENQLNQAQASKRLTEIILYCHEETRPKIFSSILNLIRYPNIITLFFIDLVKDLIFNKQMRDNNVREVLLTSIFARMNAETPQSWGLIYLARQLQIHKNQLYGLNVSAKIVDLL